MLAEDKAIQYAEDVWGDSNDSTIKQIELAYLAGHAEAKKLNEVLECPFCNSKNIKWAFRLVKQCKNCNEYFNSKS